MGLLASWREALLAQKVLLGETKGYRQHPQLTRFRACPDPLAAIAFYLENLAEEGKRRGYHFDRTKIVSRDLEEKIPVTSGQILYEWDHLKARLARRDPLHLDQFREISMPDIHPLFESIEGPVEAWEKIH